MTRELRYGAAGIIFYLLLVLNLLATQYSRNLLQKLFLPLLTTSSQIDSANTYQVIIAIIGLGALIFTSNTIGYLFGSIYIFLWNNIPGRFHRGEGGYSAEWKKLSYDIKTLIIEKYKQASRQLEENPSHDKFERQWETYSADVFLSYFWQRAPRDIVDWAVRRHTAFLTGMSTIIGISLALLLSITLIIGSNLGWNFSNFIISTVGFLMIFIIYNNAQHARSEAWQIIDLWLAHSLNPYLTPILDQTLQKSESITSKQETTVE